MMDVYRKLTGTLEPIGGGLHIDRFCAAATAAAERQARLRARREADREARRQETAARPGARAGQTRAAAAPRPDAPDLHGEVEEFLTRNSLEKPDDTEIQEFLKERAGFDPTELE